ncbi:MAG: CHAP domain-containing protein [Ktedonobacteraceae bacterium]|nr:CHAP domain-containing protein [Ktedonobacteraceae bacterium]
MPFVDNHENSTADQNSSARPLQRSGTLTQWSPAGQQDLSEQPTPSEGLLPVVQPSDPASSRITRALANFFPSPHTTRHLDPYTGPLESASQATPPRKPMLIRGSIKKAATLPPRSTRHRLRLQLIVAGVLVFLVLGAFIAVTPTNGQAGGALGIFSPILSSITTRSSNSTLLAQQAATATAVISNDGFDPGPAVDAPSGGGLARFFYGQCTYWANMRYHELTNIWVPWLGNANQWVAGAYQYGWNVSSSPHIPSIIVLMGGVQGASYYYGHVAVAESINPDGSVHTSNWNWGGAGAYTTYVDFKPGSGVYFVWAPGK